MCLKCEAFWVCLKSNIILSNRSGATAQNLHCNFSLLLQANQYRLILCCQDSEKMVGGYDNPILASYGC